MTSSIPSIAPAPAVRWEPCREFHDDSEELAGTCAECGWADDDHDALVAA
jgi:hypothetical protein